MNKTNRAYSVVFFGTPDFAVTSLKALISAQHQVKAVVTAPDKPAGRGKKPRPSAVKKYASEQGLPVMQPANLKDAAFLDPLKALNADVFAVVAFRMLPEAVWNMPPEGTINVHASLLPQYRGAAPINRVIMNGEKETGVTTFKLQHTIDTGDLLLQEKEPVHPDDNAGSLHDRLMIKGAELLVQTLNGLAKNELTPAPQEERLKPGQTLKKAPKIHKEDCRINVQRTAAELHNHIRGLSPYPGAFTLFHYESGAVKTVKIYRSEPADHSSSHEPGTVRAEKNDLILSTGAGELKILELKPEGKKTMPVRDFLNGCRNDKPVKAE